MELFERRKDELRLSMTTLCWLALTRRVQAQSKSTERSCPLLLRGFLDACPIARDPGQWYVRQFVLVAVTLICRQDHDAVSFKIGRSCYHHSYYWYDFEFPCRCSTLGFNVETVEYKRMNMTIWDVGGNR